MRVLTPTRVVSLFLALMSLTPLALTRLRVHLLPVPKSNTINVTFRYPGAYADLVEQQLTAVLEGALSRLSELQSIKSESAHSGGNITLIFSKKANLAHKQLEISAIIRQIYPQLPKGATYPEVSRSGGGSWNLPTAPILTYTIEGPAVPHQLHKIAESLIGRALTGHPELQDLQITGSSGLHLRVDYQLRQLQALGLTTNDLTTSLHNFFQLSYPGVARTASGSYFFLQVQQEEQLNDSFQETIRQLSDLPLTNRRGKIVRLGSCTKIYLEEKAPLEFHRINGQNSINLLLFPRQGANSLLLAPILRQKVADLAHNLPPGYQIRLVEDQTSYLAQELHKTKQRTGLSMGILALFLLVSYRNWRHLVVLLIGLGANLALAILCCWWLRVEIHLYSLAGLGIAFGLMIDNALVRLDYLESNAGDTAPILPILGATLTTLSVLLLVFLLPVNERLILADFCSIIALSLGTSLLVAFALIPSLYQLIQPRTPSRRPRPLAGSRWWVTCYQNYSRSIAWMAKRRLAFSCFWLFLFGVPLHLLPEKWDGQAWYNATLGSKVYQEYLRPWLMPLLGGTLNPFLANVYQSSRFRAPEKTQLMIQASLPSGSSPAQMNALLQQVEIFLAQQNGLAQYTTRVNSGESGEITIHFQPTFEKTGGPLQVKTRVVAQAMNWSGAEWNIFGVGVGFSNANPDLESKFQVQLKGYDYDELERQALRLQAQLEKNPRIQQINPNALDQWTQKASFAYNLHIDPYQLGRRGVGRAEVNQTIVEQSQAYDNLLYLPLKLQPSSPPELIPLSLSAQRAEEFSTYDLLQAPLSFSRQRQIKLHHFAQLQLTKNNPTILREERQYVRLLQFEYLGSWFNGEKFLRSALQRFQSAMPAGFSATSFENGNAVPSQLKQLWVLGLAVLCSFIITAILFENLRWPFIVISVVPLSLIGLFLIFFIGIYPFDQGGYAAIILLSGTVVNAVIFILADYQRGLDLRMQPNRALLKAILHRSRTILLTVVSTLCGLLPFLAAGPNEPFWFALAIGSIGGLVFSLVVIFTVVPVWLWQMPAEPGGKRTSPTNLLK